MFVVIDKARLGPLIAVTRDDRKPRSRAADGPYFRMETAGDSLRLTGREVEVTVPATVHEPGVLFLRVTLFRGVLRALPERGCLSIHVNGDGLVFGDTLLSLNALDALLCPDPATAPGRHPAERGTRRPRRRANPRDCSETDSRAPRARPRARAQQCALMRSQPPRERPQQLASNAAARAPRGTITPEVHDTHAHSTHQHEPIDAAHAPSAHARPLLRRARAHTAQRAWHARNHAARAHTRGAGGGGGGRFLAARARGPCGVRRGYSHGFRYSPPGGGRPVSGGREAGDGRS